MLVTSGPRCSYWLDEIPVEACAEESVAKDLYRWADVVLGTHAGRGHILRDAARAGRPIAFYLQLGRTPRHLMFGTPDLTVLNSYFLGREYGRQRAVVLHPPIDEVDYLTTRGDAITLVNPIDEKGIGLLLALARRLPTRGFLTVMGRSLQPLPASLPPNLTVLSTQADMRVVYGRTRILLVPSAYESYGRVGLEAAVSGIPTIAHDITGLRESLADAALWVDPTAPLDDWIARIAELDDPETYAQWSARARRRFDELDPDREFDEFERALVRLAT
ncbi:MAG TPA: glycosyltransferase [Acidimicrobiia bacterium]|nr:glycosyltransferase [Acidimicrobiia bacterium]